MSGLLSLSHGGGCGCKLAPDALAHVLAAVTRDGAGDGGVLRGLADRDDAAVVALGDRTLVLTCDFFTPVVDDPRAWGRIAAANALSDVYAMGATPRFALNHLAWPRDGVPGQRLEAVLAGGLEALAEAGAVLVGGHSIDDPEPKYGMTIVGEVDPARMLRNDAARAGDMLVLTKPLGVGVVVTAAKLGRAPAELIAAATRTMQALNRHASEVAVAHGLLAATDVTGFGLAGHAQELAERSGVAVELVAADVPSLPGVGELLLAGCAPAGTARNLAAGAVDWAGLARVGRELLCDPQSSGGLLLAVPADGAGALLDDLGPPAAVVGRVVDGPPGHVRVRA